MAQRRKIISDSQLKLDFESILKQGETLSRDEVVAKLSPEQQSDYNPVERTADYMKRSLEVEKSWETTLKAARESLLTKDPRKLYWEFIKDLSKQIEQGSPQSARLATLLEHVVHRGLGMSSLHHIRIQKPDNGRTRWKVDFKDDDRIQQYLAENIEGQYFLNEISGDSLAWEGVEPLVGASDVSQHRSAVPVPSRFFKRSVPFLLNNAAGTVFRIQDGWPKYEPIFDPRPNEPLLRWMLIDPSYQDELEPEDFQRCVATSMDVGQYRFDFEKLLSADKRIPDIIFRDGSLFPQDAYLDNYLTDNKRGEFTREAINKLLDCIQRAELMSTVYCGVVKSVQLKVYSALVDWFINKYINDSWGLGGYTLNDGQAMSLLLSSPSFVEGDLKKVVSTCLIKRSFTTRANLNQKADLNDLDRYFRQFEGSDISIKPYRELCNIAHAYMFYLGHSKSPQQQLPRYEFFYNSKLGTVSEVACKILSAVRYCGLSADLDHSMMSEEAMQYLLPSVSYQAHRLSKDVGKQIDSETGQWIMARYRSMITKDES